MNRIAVVIVNYNAGQWLYKCLGSIESQTVRPARVLVMDNGSVDDSISLCRAAFPAVEYHLLGDNLGFARANNLAAELVLDCEWLALLNPDAFAAPNWIEVFLRRSREFSETHAFASCMLSARDPSVIDGAGDVYRVDGLAWPRSKGAKSSELPTDSDYVFSASGGAGFYRRAVFLEVGGFCERYFCYYEDVDLGFRLRLRGYQCRFLPDAVVHHVGSAVAGEGSDFSVYHVHRNVVWTYVRNMPGLFLWVYLPAHLAANLASVFALSRKGKGGVVIRAKLDAIWGLDLTMRERRAIQSARTLPAGAILGAMQRGNLFVSIFRRMYRRLKGPFVRQRP